MEITSSYIFLKKESSNSHAESNLNIIDIDKDQSVFRYISKIYPTLKIIHESSNLFKTKASIEMQYEGINYIVNLTFNSVMDNTYLDIKVSGSRKNKCINLLEDIQNKIFENIGKNKYTCIISYDAISEYYCNKIMPKLNCLERNLRKLLLNVYIVNFNRNYYKTTVNKEIQKSVKEKIKARKDKDKELQEFFYSTTINEVQQILFEPKWNKLNEIEIDNFLKNKDDLSSLSDKQLRTFITSIKPKSDWDRFFSDKITINNPEDIINELRIHRNNVAHFKFFSKEEFNQCNKLINELNSSIEKAIIITEEIDFTNKNSEYLKQSFVSLNKRIIDMTRNFAEAFSPIISQTKEISEESTKVVNLIKSIAFSQ